MKSVFAGYFTMKTLRKFAVAFQSAACSLAGKSVSWRDVSISQGNTKMGSVASVSLLPYLTCPQRCQGTCGARCYAAKLAVLRSSVLQAWSRNTVLAREYPFVYWEGVSRAMRTARFFRFHVAGDIPSSRYFSHMVQITRENPNTDVLCFTKRYDVVNDWISAHGALPANLHILFSGWSNLTPNNPYDLPETTVIEKGSAPAPGWKVCPGNCAECAGVGAGCWGASQGDTIAFHIH